MVSLKNDNAGCGAVILRFHGVFNLHTDHTLSVGCINLWYILSVVICVGGEQVRVKSCGCQCASDLNSCIRLLTRRMDMCYG